MKRHLKKSEVTRSLLLKYIDKFMFACGKYVAEKGRKELLEESYEEYKTPWLCIPTIPVIRLHLSNDTKRKLKESMSESAKSPYELRKEEEK